MSLALALALLVSSPVELLSRGNQAYEAGRYQAAVALYDSALVSAYRADLYYNRGNAHFKLGQIGKATADYLRAHAIKPWDRDIRYNLAFARQFRPDKRLLIENPLLRALTQATDSTLTG